MNEGNNKVFCSADYCRELKAKNEELQDKHWSECRQIAHYENELRKAKELLKAAVEDMGGMQFGDECKVCSKKLLPNECPVHNNVSCILKKDFKWRYADEALTLIGKDTNVPAREDGELNDT